MCTKNDRVYFRESRERRFGMTLEEVAADRDEKVVALRQALQPVRTTLSNQPFVNGETHAYADYIVFGAFQWARCTSSFKLLDPNDPIAAWRERMLDAFGSLARNAPGYDC